VGRDLLLLGREDLDRPGQLLDVQLGEAGDGLVRHQPLDPAPVLSSPRRHLDPGHGTEGRPRRVVAQDGRQAGQQPGHVLLVGGRAAHQLGPEDVEAALEQPPQIGDVGLLGLGLLTAGAQLGQAELVDPLGEPRVKDPVDAALAAWHYLHAHPSPLVLA
jgi:hypothetical protein